MVQKEVQFRRDKFCRRDRVGFTGPFGVHPVFGVCPRRLDSGSPAPPGSPASGAKGRAAGWGRGRRGDKGRGHRAPAGGCGGELPRRCWDSARPRSEKPAQRWSALGCRLGPRRPNPQARRPHRPLPRLHPLSPAPRRPRRLRARRTWRRRRRSGGTLYLSTGPTACAGTAASSSSSAAQESGAAGEGVVPGRGAGPGGRPPGGGGANRCTSFSAVTNSAARPGCTHAPGSRSTPAT